MTGSRHSIRICFLGDSFVNGTGDPTGLGWVGRICAAARRRGSSLTCYNLGIRRETSAGLLSRWREEVARRRPPDDDAFAIVLSFGANDCASTGLRRRVPESQTLANARSILNRAARFGPVLMVGPPPVPDAGHTARIAALSGALAQLCAELGVPCLDVVAGLAGSGPWLREAASGDGAHPQAAGYAQLARLVGAWPPWRSLAGMDAPRRKRERFPALHSALI